MQDRRFDDEASGELVMRRALREKSIAIASRWRRYACCMVSSVPCKEQRRDLHMP